MDWTIIDWSALERMRGAFLEGSSGREDYWRSESDLAAYDQTFAQRIAWKWDFVLAGLARRGWQPPAGDVLDWGCGSGIAGRAFLGQFRQRIAGSLILYDRSGLATDYAARRARERFPGLSVVREDASGAEASGEDASGGRTTGKNGNSENESASSASTILVSHVLSELSPPQVDALVERVRRATAVLWVEPGTFQTSRSLIDCRERLRDEFQIVAPCTHQAVCGLLAPENDRHWCHQFSHSPPEVFMDRDWARFARLAGIDLRSLPLSFLVLDKRPPPPLPTGAVRVVGRPRMRKDCALLFGCDESGVRDRRLAKRAFPQEYRRCKRGDFDTLQACRLEGDEIVALAQPPEVPGRG